MTNTKRGWRWSFTPTRLITDERFLNLDHLDRLILLTLYMRATQYGRFSAGKMSLAITLGIIDPAVDLSARVKHLAGLGFLELYEVDGQQFGELERYDDDAPAELIRKRGSEILPGIPTTSAKQADKGRKPRAQKRREEKRENREKRKGHLAPYEDA